MPCLHEWGLNNLLGCWYEGVPKLQQLKKESQMEQLIAQFSNLMINDFGDRTCCWCAIWSSKYLIIIDLKSRTRFTSKRSISFLISCDISSNSCWQRCTLASHSTISFWAASILSVRLANSSLDLFSRRFVNCSWECFQFWKTWQ